MQIQIIKPYGRYLYNETTHQVIDEDDQIREFLHLGITEG